MGHSVHKGAVRLVEDFMGAPVQHQSKEDDTEALSILDPQVLWHDSLLPAESPSLKGVHQLRLLRAHLLASFPDLTYKVTELVDADDQLRVVVYWRARGAHTGVAFRGSAPATGLHIHAAGSLVLKFAEPGGATAVEAWCSWDPLLVMRQLGVEPEATANGSSAHTSTSAAAPVQPAAQSRTKLQLPAAVQARVSNPDAQHAPLAIQDVAATYFYVYNTGEFELLQHIVHEDYRYEGLLDLGAKRGEAAMRAMMGGWRDALPDLNIYYEWLGFETFYPQQHSSHTGEKSGEGGVATSKQDEGSWPSSKAAHAAAALLGAGPGDGRILFRWVIEGTHTGSAWCGVGPTGKRIVSRGVTALTVREHRIARKISHANGQDVLRQLGVLNAESSVPGISI